MILGKRCQKGRLFSSTSIDLHCLFPFYVPIWPCMFLCCPQLSSALGISIHCMWGKLGSEAFWRLPYFWASINYQYYSFKPSSVFLFKVFSIGDLLFKYKQFYDGWAFSKCFFSFSGRMDGHLKWYTNSPVLKTWSEVTWVLKKSRNIINSLPQST